jgi:hypothetical protein
MPQANTRMLPRVGPMATEALMRKRNDDDDDMHWEQLVRTMIDILGVEQFNEIIQYVVEQMNEERLRLYHFAIETQREDA